MATTLLFITKLISYLKIINVCFINELLDYHVIDLIYENSKNLSNNRSSSKIKALASNKSDTYDLLEEDERTRSIPILLGDHNHSISDFQVSPRGPTYPSLVAVSSQVHAAKQKETPPTFAEKDPENNFLLMDAEKSERAISDTMNTKRAGYKVNLLAAVCMTLLLMMRMGHHKSSNLNRVLGVRENDSLNIVILPATLTAVDYTICENYPLVTRFLMNIMLLEVYANLTSFNFNLALKFIVWLSFLAIHVSTMKFNKFAIRTLNNLETHDNFKLFQVSLNNKLVIFRILVFAFLSIYMPLVTLIPLILLIKMIISIVQIINLRFEKQDDPYHLFKICLTVMTWICSVTVFGEPSNEKSQLQMMFYNNFGFKNHTLWFNLIFIFKRFCLIMSCKYFAVLTFDYKLTLVPLPAIPDVLNLHILRQPISLFQNRKYKDEHILAKCFFIESVRVEEEEDTRNAEDKDFSAVVFLTNKRLVKWTNDGYSNVTRDTFKSFSWLFFKKNFLDRELEIIELLNFKHHLIDLNHGEFSDEIGKESIDLFTQRESRLLVSSCKRQFAWIHYINETNFKVTYFDIESERSSVKQFDFNDMHMNDVVTSYFFQEGPLGQDPAQYLIFILKSAEVIEINLAAQKVIKRKLNLIQKVDNWVRLKTDRIAERCVIYESSKKYIGHYVKFRGWKILPFPMDASHLIGSKNVVPTMGGNKMSTSKSMMSNFGGSKAGIIAGGSKLKMTPMLHQTSDPLTRMDSRTEDSTKKEIILKIDTLEHLGFICEVSEILGIKKSETWYVKLIECASGKVMKKFTINNKNVLLDSIKISHERKLKFCGFCGFLSCKKLHLHYLVTSGTKNNKGHTNYQLVIYDLINNRVNNVKKQRICFRNERDDREVRCYGLNKSVEFKMVYKLTNAVNKPVYNPYNDEYCYVKYADNAKRCFTESCSQSNIFSKISLAKLGKAIQIPIDKSHNNLEDIAPFNGFRYNIPKPSTDEEIRRTDLLELENDVKEIDKHGCSDILNLKYLYNTAEDCIFYYY